MSCFNREPCCALQAFAFVEIFAGLGNVTRMMRKSGYKSAAVDITYDYKKHGKSMDFLSAPGFVSHCCSTSV